MDNHRIALWIVDFAVAYYNWDGLNLEETEGQNRMRFLREYDKWLFDQIAGGPFDPVTHGEIVLPAFYIYIKELLHDSRYENAML